MSTTFRDDWPHRLPEPSEMRLRTGPLTYECAYF
jgi:hypothetical protein